MHTKKEMKLRDFLCKIGWFNYCCLKLHNTLYPLLDHLRIKLCLLAYTGIPLDGTAIDKQQNCYFKPFPCIGQLLKNINTSQS